MASKKKITKNKFQSFQDTISVSYIFFLKKTKNFKKIKKKLIGREKKKRDKKKTKKHKHS